MLKARPPGAITVTDPMKVNDTLVSYVKYKVKMTAFPLVTVYRRYNDFLWLHEILTDECPDCIIPELPKKRSSGRFDKVFIELRRRALESFMNGIVSHLVLAQSPHVELFLTANEDSFLEGKNKAPVSSASTGSWLPSSFITGPSTDKVGCTSILNFALP